jgi:molybdopterin-guanine dinucleotide biosynthesis protein A
MVKCDSDHGVTMNWDDATILILAGGRSDRFGKVKSLITFEGKRLIQHVHDRVTGPSDRVVISCKSDGDSLAGLFPGSMVIVDDSRIKGPLAGLRSALPHIETELVMVVPCDSPRISRAVMGYLVEVARGCDAAIPAWPNGFIEPLTAVYRTSSVRRAVEEAWNRGVMRLSTMIDMMGGVNHVPMREIERLDPDLETFINLNSLADIILLQDDVETGASGKRSDPLDA